VKLSQGFAIIATLALLATARGEVPPLSPERQKADATDIAIGDVVKVDSATNGNETTYESTLRVVASEKGSRWQAGDTLPARAGFACKAVVVSKRCAR
jgi:hypothetical protein